MNRRTLILRCAAYLACGAVAGGVEFTYPKGAKIGGLSNWPNGLYQCANVESRVYGHSINATDVHFYAGDVAELNRFLNNYAKVGLARHDLVVHPGNGQIDVPDEQGKGKVKLPFDWKLSVSPGGGRTNGQKINYNATISVYLAGQIKRDELKIPQGMFVDDRTPPSVESK